MNVRLPDFVLSLTAAQFLYMLFIESCDDPQHYKSSPWYTTHLPLRLNPTNLYRLPNIICPMIYSI